MSTIRGVLLDVDGTLVDSNDAHAHAWVKAFAENGIDVAFGDVRPLIGMGGDKFSTGWPGCGRTTRKRSESAPGARRSSRRNSSRPSGRSPRTRELLTAMRSRGLRLVAASSAKEDELKGLLAVAGAEDLLEDQTSSDDAEQSKPDPDIITAALEKIGLPAEEVVMLGDTPYDVEAAGRARVSHDRPALRGLESRSSAGCPGRLRRPRRPAGRTSSPRPWDDPNHDRNPSHGEKVAEGRMRGEGAAAVNKRMI